MKRLISLLLSTLIVCISLASCATDDTSSPTSDTSEETQLAPYTIEFEDVQTGYITHLSQTEWSVTAADGFQCTGDFYAYLPAGSTLSSEKNFAAYCYNKNFALNLTLTENCGQTLFRLSPQMNTDKLVLTSDCYVRFSVNGTLSDIKIEVPEESKETVLCGNKNSLVYSPQIKVLKQELAGKEGAVNYIFITDLHYGNDPTSQQGEALINQVKAAVEMANSIAAIDFIVIGGDTTSGMYESKADAIKYTTEVLTPLKECHKPVFVLMGNHDDNSYHRFTYDVYYPDRILSDKDWNDNILKEFCPEDIVQDKSYEYSKYYYYDLPEKKTRVICLDALDYRAKFDKNGVISELPIKDADADAHVSKYWSGCSWWGYSNEQMQWLATEAMSADTDWDYVFLSHMGIDSETNSYGYSTKSGATLRKLISAFQNKTTLKSGGIFADFSDTKGKILSYQFGHIHMELTHYSKDIDLWQTTTATANVGQSATGKTVAETSVTEKSLDWMIYDRILGGESEACFDIMSVSDEVIYKYAFGAGSNEEMNY